MGPWRKHQFVQPKWLGLCKRSTSTTSLNSMMGYLERLKGSRSFRQRLLLSTLSSTPILIEDIRADETWPGLRNHEISLLRLFETVCDDCHVEINETALWSSFEDLELKVESRGLPPNGGGEVVLSVPVVQNLTAVSWIDEGFVRKIRGITFSTRVSVQFEYSMIKSARGIINPLVSDVHIFSDHRSGPEAGNSPGYGISLVAETTSGCFISADTAVSQARDEDTSGLADDAKRDLMPPDDIGVGIANALVGEIAQNGVVDSTHQGLLFLLCALCPQDVSKVRVGKLSQHGVETLRNLRDFLDLKFIIKPDPNSQSVFLKCIGYGMKNLSQKVS
ncbi:hypothetical protein JHK87_001768 [Glycine soja]|nr:hypothetical protein JHK87_001768 [Glycine soja]